MPGIKNPIHEMTSRQRLTARASMQDGRCRRGSERYGYLKKTFEHFFEKDGCAIPLLRKKAKKLLEYSVISAKNAEKVFPPPQKLCYTIANIWFFFMNQMRYY